jgi:hypothetical protein
MLSDTGINMGIGEVGMRVDDDSEGGAHVDLNGIWVA